MLKLILLAKKIEIISIKEKENKTIINQVIQANFENNSCLKLCHLLIISYSTKKIDSCQFSDLLVDFENYINQFGQL